MNFLTRKYFRVAVVLCLYGSVFAQTTNKFPYKIENMPFNMAAVERPIDRDCSDRGRVSKNSGTFAEQEAQNQAKNNFGVTDSAVPITIADFDRLEKAALAARNCWAKNLAGCRKLPLKNGLPVDRQQLKNITSSEIGDEIGEGTLVTLEAKVLDSHYSNTEFNKYGNAAGNGEPVNCKNLAGTDSSEIDRNDIHLVLTLPGEKRPCYSVTVEISPHFRPEAWRRFHDMKGKVNDQAKGVNFKKVQLVRITGPLFYDASHDPCSSKPNGEMITSSPARRSIWEIHPAYKIEVKVNDQWLSFADWAETQ